MTEARQINSDTEIENVTSDEDRMNWSQILQQAVAVVDRQVTELSRCLRTIHDLRSRTDPKHT